MAVQRIYHWKHGWIPLDHYAAVEKDSGRESAKLPSLTGRQTAPVRSMDEMSAGLQGKINAKLEATTGLPEPELAAKVQDNLVRLYGQGNASELAWYHNEGADIAARAAAIRADFPDSTVTAEQLTGMVAVTSAHKRWLENKQFAEAVARKLAADEPFELDQATIDNYNAFIAKRKGSGSMAAHPELTPGTYRPSELPTDFAVSKTPGMPKHLNTDFVVSAAKIYRGESTVDQQVLGPKQRSFVNNLLAPDDPRSATVDTWHYRAAMAGIPLTKTIGPKGNQRTYTYTLEQWSDRDLARQDGRAALYGYDPNAKVDGDNLKKIMQAADAFSPQAFFQSGPASKADDYSGNYGTYPWFVKQTQAAASKVGVAPSALQAVAWYAVGGGV